MQILQCYFRATFCAYSEVSIIRPGRSRLLEFEIEYWPFNRDFFKKCKPGLLVETRSKLDGTGGLIETFWKKSIDQVF